MESRYIEIEESGLGVEFVDEVSRLAELRGRISELEEQAKSLRESIQNRMLDSGVAAVRGAGYRVSVQVRETKRLSADKLVAQGVSPDVIAAATDVTTYTVLDVRRER